MINDTDKMHFTCRQCIKIYSSQSNLNRHLIEVHGLQAEVIVHDISVKSFKCLEGCNISFARHRELVHHLKEEHSIQIEEETSHFDSMDEFLKWLKDLQDFSNVEYIKPCGRRTLGRSSAVYYICNRSGQTRGCSETNEVTKSNTRRSKKMSSSCTSQIKIVLNSDSSVSMTYVRTHYGHDFEVSHTKSPKKKKMSTCKEILSAILKDKNPTNDIDIIYEDDGSSISNSEENSVHLRTLPHVPNNIKDTDILKQNVRTLASKIQDNIEHMQSIEVLKRIERILKTVNVLVESDFNKINKLVNVNKESADTNIERKRKLNL